MIGIHSVLVIVDPTAQAHPAIDKAVSIALKCNARIELFACETRESRNVRYAAHLARGKGDFVLSLRAILEPLAERIRERGIDACIDTEYGDPLHTILHERVQRTCADLVVKDTHHHSLAKRTFITNTDWQLIRGCAAPLLLTKPTPWRDAPVIAAALDPVHVNDKPAEFDQRILDWARLLSTRLGGSLHAVHAYFPGALMAEVAGGFPPMASLLDAQMLEQERAARLAVIEALTLPYGIAPEHLHLQMGVAVDVLPRVAADIGADVLALGAISRSGLQRVFIGSTAETVLEHLPCDALIVKPTDFAAEMSF